jgi:hypothetical protein
MTPPKQPASDTMGVSCVSALISEGFVLIWTIVPLISAHPAIVSEPVIGICIVTSGIDAFPCTTAFPLMTITVRCGSWVPFCGFGTITNDSAYQTPEVSLQRNWAVGRGGGHEDWGAAAAWVGGGSTRAGWAAGGGNGDSTSVGTASATGLSTGAASGDIDGATAGDRAGAATGVGCAIGAAEGIATGGATGAAIGDDSCDVTPIIEKMATRPVAVHEMDCSVFAGLMLYWNPKMLKGCDQ